MSHRGYLVARRNYAALAVRKQGYEHIERRRMVGKLNLYLLTALDTFMRNVGLVEAARSYPLYPALAKYGRVVCLYKLILER